MFIYSIHTPSKTFAVPFHDGEKFVELLDRILGKASFSSDDSNGVKDRKDGAGLAYEFEGGRWSLEDGESGHLGTDNDLEILQARLPPDSTSTATLHLTPPHAHARFAALLPAYSSASSAVKDKAQNGAKKPALKKSSSPAKPFATTNGEPAGVSGYELGKPAAPVPEPYHATEKTNWRATSGGSYGPSGARKMVPPPSDSAKKITEEWKTSPNHWRKAPSIKSNSSRKSKFENIGQHHEDDEPWIDSHKRLWVEFQNNNGVRTVVGRVNNVSNVRMLLKSGYKNVTISRSFALRHGLVGPSYAMGASGYMGAKTLGTVNIAVGSKTAAHPAFINEDQHFDVVLGRTWSQKMGVKFDNLDQTIVTYMDNGEAISCDIVVLKDAEGEVVYIP